MHRYSAFIAHGSGDYREVDWVIEAPDPSRAAQQVIESDAIQPSDDFPIILIVEERAITIFTRDRGGHVVTPIDDIRRRLDERRDGPQLHVLPEEGSDHSQ